MQCRHLDGNPSNNRPDNLRWGTAKENAADMIRHGRLRLPPHYRPLPLSLVVELFRSGGTIHGIARRLGVGRCAVRSALRKTGLRSA
jgi:hypothetical protein